MNAYPTHMPRTALLALTATVLGTVLCTAAPAQDADHRDRTPPVIASMQLEIGNPDAGATLRIQVEDYDSGRLHALLFGHTHGGALVASSDLRATLLPEQASGRFEVPVPAAMVPHLAAMAADGFALQIVEIGMDQALRFSGEVDLAELLAGEDPEVSAVLSWAGPVVHASRDDLADVRARDFNEPENRTDG